MATEQNKSTAAPRAGAIDPASKGPVTANDKPPETNEGLSTVEGREANARVEDERLKALNEGNREGHDKNMKKIEEHAEAAAKASEAGPTSGREWNRNTPRIDKDGNKHWS